MCIRYWLQTHEMYIKCDWAVLQVQTLSLFQVIIDTNTIFFMIPSNMRLSLIYHKITKHFLDSLQHRETIAQNVMIFDYIFVRIVNLLFGVSAIIIILGFWIQYSTTLFHMKKWNGKWYEHKRINVYKYFAGEMLYNSRFIIYLNVHLEVPVS